MCDHSQQRSTVHVFVHVAHHSLATPFVRTFVRLDTAFDDDDMEVRGDDDDFDSQLPQQQQDVTDGQSPYFLHEPSAAGNVRGRGGKKVGVERFSELDCA